MSTPTPSSSTSIKPTSKTVTSDTETSKPPTERWSVKLTHPLERKRRVFSSVSENRARRFIVTRYPRGEEAYLEAPTGTTESYQEERAGPYGEDMDKWQPFDPDAWQPPEEAQPPGESAWADVEG
jgi:hypothetical protein